MTTLYLSLKGEYFHQIKDGTKLVEYRLCTERWCKRLIGRTYTRIELAWGYPKKERTDRRIVRAWNGYTIETITHPHFGPDPVTVFSIDVSHAA